MNDINLIKFDNYTKNSPNEEESLREMYKFINQLNFDKILDIL